MKKYSRLLKPKIDIDFFSVTYQWKEDACRICSMFKFMTLTAQTTVLYLINYKIPNCKFLTN
jgi:hypothetical protein